jgi:cytochrome b561
MIRLAHLAHWGLYALLLALVPLGFAIRWSGNHPLSFFGLIDIPAAFRLARPNARSARELHELAANILMALAGLHAAAALFHQYVLRDGVLARMLPAAWLSRLGLSPGNTQMLEPR